MAGGFLTPDQRHSRKMFGNAVPLGRGRQVELGKERYTVRLTPSRHLRQVDFVFDGNQIRGLEQNPDTKSRWAQMARSGKQVMQFLSEGCYVANVVDGKVTLYGGRGRTSR